MRHVAVLTQPVGWFHNVAAFPVAHDTRRLPELRLRVLPLLRIQPIAVLVIRLLLVVHEKVNARREEVHGRGLEKLIRTATSLFLAFLQGLQQGLRRLARRRKVVDVLRLDGVHPATVLHVHEIYHIEFAVGRRLSQTLVLQVVVIQFRGQCRELVVIGDHRKALGRVLPDERFDDAHGLAASRRPDHPCSSETVADIHPALAELALVVVPHRDIHAVPVLDQLLALLETFVLEVEAVLHQSLLDELRYVVQGDMHQHYARDRCRHVQDDVQRQRVEPQLHRPAEQPYREHQQRQSEDDREQHLPLGVELQMLLVSRADTGNTDQQYRSRLAVHQISVRIDHPPLDAAMDVAQYAAPVVQRGRVDGVGEELQQHGDVHRRAEYFVEPLQLLALFHCPDQCFLMPQRTWMWGQCKRPSSASWLTWEIPYSGSTPNEL